MEERRNDVRRGDHRYRTGRAERGAGFDLGEDQREPLAARDVTVLDRALESVDGDGASLTSIN